MAIGKNKKLGKARKGGRKKLADPFLKKEWYDVRTPAVFPVKSAGKTIATKTQGTKIARDTLMGRVIEVSLGDLKQNTEEEAFRKFKLRVEDVNGFNCLTQFHGMDLTTDKLRSLVRKWQTLIEAYVDIRTNDGYALRLFAIGFTKKHRDHVKKTAYASSAQVRAIRKKMIEVVNKETANIDLHQLVDKLMIETIGKEIEKHTNAIYPLQNCLIRKVKVLRSPKVDVSKLVEAAGGSDALSKATGAMHVPVKVAAPAAAEDAGAKVEAKKDKADAKAGKADAKSAKADSKAAAKPAKAAAPKDAAAAASPSEKAAPADKADKKAAKGGDDKKKGGDDKKKGGDDKKAKGGDDKKAAKGGDKKGK